MERKKRLQYMDLAKGIGVCLVILGHMPSVVPLPIRNWIYSFHMPLFFIISGYFAKQAEQKEALADIIEKKFKKLILKGYLLFGLVFLSIEALLHGFTIQEFGKEIEVLLLGNTTHVIWFFLSLFTVEVLFACSTFFTKKLPFRLLICVLIVVFGFALGCEGWNYYRIGSSFYAYGFYFLGYLANKYKFFEIAKRKRIILVVIAIFINIFGTVCLLRLKPMVLDINSNSHHDILANYMIALGGSYSILFFCKIISGVNSFLPIRFLGYIGKNSFFFFTLTNFAPEAFTSIVHNENIVSKLGAYVIGIAIACALSELVAYLRKRRLREEKS